MNEPLRLLVLCTANRCRSQMAEAWLRHFAPQGTVVLSAGTKPRGAHPMAIKVMAEAGVSISGVTSTHVDRFVNESFDVVITVCDSAKEACPVFSNTKRTVHKAFDDPDDPALSDDARRELFCRVRDDIRDWARDFIQTHQAD